MLYVISGIWKSVMVNVSHILRMFSHEVYGQRVESIIKTTYKIRMHTRFRCQVTTIKTKFVINLYPFYRM